MLVILGSADKYLSDNVGRIINEAELKCIRTNVIDRIIKELKKPGRIAIIDMAWEEVQKTGVLRQLINIGRITDNKVLCICPNQEEDLKKLARNARAAEVFLRYDLETSFKTYLKEL